MESQRVNIPQMPPPNPSQIKAHGIESISQDRAMDTRVIQSLPISVPSRSYISRQAFKPTLPQPLIASPFQLPRNRDLCRMDNCFDFSKCHKGLRIYVYPLIQTGRTQYRRMMDIIKSSKYYTDDPQQACVFVGGIETLDERPLTVNGTVVSRTQTLQDLPYWNKGVNHLIINHYTGNGPDYSDRISFDVGYAILAKASTSTQHFRHGFDISLPLIGGGFSDYYNANQDRPLVMERQYLIGFKGARYLGEYTSRSRIYFPVMDNGKDIILATRCRGNTGRFEKKEDRCPEEDERYHK